MTIVVPSTTITIPASEAHLLLAAVRCMKTSLMPATTVADTSTSALDAVERLQALEAILAKATP